MAKLALRKTGHRIIKQTEYHEFEIIIYRCRPNDPTRTKPLGTNHQTCNSCRPNHRTACRGIVEPNDTGREDWANDRNYHRRDYRPKPLGRNSFLLQRGHSRHPHSGVQSRLHSERTLWRGSNARSLGRIDCPYSRALHETYRYPMHIWRRPNARHHIYHRRDAFPAKCEYGSYL